MTEETSNGWVKLYHPTGVQVTLPVPVTELLTGEQATGMLASVSAYISAGWLTELPGLEDGEKNEGG